MGPLSAGIGPWPGIRPESCPGIGPGPCAGIAPAPGAYPCPAPSGGSGDPYDPPYEAPPYEAAAGGVAGGSGVPSGGSGIPVRPCGGAAGSCRDGCW